MKIIQGDEPIAVILKDGTVFEFSQGCLNIFESVEDMDRGADTINIYELEPMYRIDEE